LRKEHGEGRNVYRIGALKGSDHWKDLGVDGRITLRCP